FPMTFGILDAFNLKFDSGALSNIRTELEVLKMLKHELDELPKIDGLEVRELNIPYLQDILGALNPALDWANRWNKNEALNSLANWNAVDFKSQLTSLSDFSKSFQTSFLKWKTYLSDSQILYILQSKTLEIDSE